ncbi:alpha/beta fold hydrolase [Jatrophihabitans sp. DSM 45814]
MSETQADDSGAAQTEFDALSEVAAELGLGADSIPSVRRTSVDIGTGQKVSVLVWGTADPELVFVHGGGQNAHTWDLVAMRLGRPAIAVDLPGHGHSDWRPDHDYWPVENAIAIAAAIAELAPNAAAVIGMSLGGLTTIRLASTRPDLVRRAVIVDVTPGVMLQTKTMTEEQRGTTALVGGQKTFATREEMVQAAVRASPRRPAEAVRRGVIHNTKQLADGTWAWRYDLPGDRKGPTDFSYLWDDVGSIAVPVLQVRGGESVFVSDADVAEFARRAPASRSEVVPGAGHSIQSDQPNALATLIEHFVFD